MRQRGLRLLSCMAVSPTLCLVIFTQTIGHTRLEGVPYSTFLLPGLVVPFHSGPFFWSGMFLNNFIITPMAFLGGTFFSVKTVPEWASILLNMLPLTQSSSLIRQASLGSPVQLFRLAALIGMGIVFSL